MIIKFNNIKGLRFEEILKSSTLTLDLLLLASKLLLNGATPRGCSASMLDYYNRICTFNDNQILDIMNKTNKLKAGMLHVPSAGLILSDEHLSDAKAVEYLAKGYISEAHFEVLPAEWVKQKAGLNAKKSKK
jgi:hypothetical protein